MTNIQLLVLLGGICFALKLHRTGKDSSLLWSGILLFGAAFLMFLTTLGPATHGGY